MAGYAGPDVMDEFTLDDELEMMAGIREGLGPYSDDVMPWIELKVRSDPSLGACVDVFYDPPGTTWRMEKVVLAHVPQDRLTAISKLVGHNMAAYHRKWKHLDKESPSG